jgi:multidrug efflux pump subunit AcrA (membrane-fusion protein)
MSPGLRQTVKTGAALLVLAVLAGAWVVYYHSEWVAAHAPKAGWVQATIRHLGKSVPEEAEEDEDPDNTKNEIPVKVAEVKVGTVRRYVEGYGQVVPRPAQKGEMAGGASIAAPVGGVVAKVDCVIGQRVKAGDVLVELDPRLAQAAADQAQAAVAEAQAALAALKATPRREQLEIGQLAVDKARTAVELAQKNYDRQKQLVAEEVAAAKVVEQAAADLASAKNDLTVAQGQLALLKASPTPEELKQGEAKVNQAQAALAAAEGQLQMLAVRAPIDATVVSIGVNPGESVDPAKVIVGLVAMDRLMIDMDVPADELPAKAEGLAVEILLPGGPKPGEAARTLTSAVAFVSPQVEVKNGGVMVGISLPEDPALRPGLTLRVKIIVAEHKDALLVPRQAVVQDENGDHVISIVTGEQAVHRTVQTGLEENGMMEIIDDGVKEGTKVVTEGAFGLRETQATHVKVVE